MNVSITGKPVKCMGYKLRENYKIERKPRSDSFNRINCGRIAGLPAIRKGYQNER